jgi:hypothetical protein
MYGAVGTGSSAAVFLVWQRALWTTKPYKGGNSEGGILRSAYGSLYIAGYVLNSILFITFSKGVLRLHVTTVCLRMMNAWVSYHHGMARPQLRMEETVSRYVA